MKQINIVCPDILTAMGLQGFINQIQGEKISCSLYTNTDEFEKGENCDMLLLAGRSVIELTKDLKEVLRTNPQLMVLIVSAYPQFIFAKRFIRDGAYGFMELDHVSDELEKAVSQILLGEKYVSEAFMKHAAYRYIGQKPLNPFEMLSNREIEVSLQLLEGTGTSDISRSLGLHVSTTNTHKARVFKKLHVKNFVEFLDLASRHSFRTAGAGFVSLFTFFVYQLTGYQF